MKGLMDTNEYVYLKELASSVQENCGTVVELGCYEGKSTSVLCEVFGSAVVSIDNFADSEDMRKYRKSSKEIVYKNLAALNYYPTIIKGSSCDVPNFIYKVKFLLIDTTHTAEHLKKEIEVWVPLLVKNAIVVMHDYGHPRYKEMTKFIYMYFVGESWERVGLMKWLIGFKYLGNTNEN